MRAELAEPLYPPSRIKRFRRTKADLAYLHEAMIASVRRLRPMTLRQLFYSLVVQGIIEKTESEYAAVGDQLLKLRRRGVIPWSAISDNTRWVRKARTFDSVEDALEQTAKLYRRTLFWDVDEHVEVWCEKDALAGVILGVTEVYDVPLYVSRGFASETYLYEAAEAIVADGRPTVIYEFGDHDPSGVAASRATERKLIGFIDGRVDVRFIRAAVRPEQITAWQLPTRPTKREGNSHARDFVGDSVELDAIPPDQLRALVRLVLEDHIPQSVLQAAKVAEDSERELLRIFARNARNTADGRAQ